MIRKTLLGAVFLAILSFTAPYAGDMGFGLPDPNAPDAGKAVFSFSLKDKPLLAVSLLPESPVIAPGVPFRLLLEMDHLDGSYSYWLNPGGPGLGTVVKWNVPEGFVVSPPEWPAPDLLRKSGITSYIHRGKTAVVYTVVPPKTFAPGQKAVLTAEVDAQVCTPKSCIPTKVSAKTTLEGAAAPGQPAPATRVAFTRAMAKLPAPVKDWRFTAREEGRDIVLSMRPEAGAADTLKDVYFFERGSGEMAADSQRPQVLEREGEGGWLLRIPLSPENSAGSVRLDGVLSSETGWLRDAAAPTAFALEMPVESRSAAGRTVKPAQGLPGLLLFAFLGGLILNVMPCVFPVIGLKIMGFARQAHQNRGEMFRHGLCYAAGVLLSFWVLAAVIIGVGRGWGAQLQSVWFLFALCHLFMLMAMNMTGVFDVGLLVAGAGQSLTGGKGFKRSFLTGLLATVISTPCSAPFLGTALAYALAQPSIAALGMFTLMGVGFSFPYLILSLFPGWLKKLPKPGPWMDTFRQALSFPLFGAVVYLAWTMEAMLTEWRFLMLLFGLVLTGMACWMYGRRQKTRDAFRGASRVWLVAAGLALFLGVWMGIPKMETALHWGEWSPETVSRLRAEGRPVYVDFTARWCATCQVNKRIWQNADLAALILAKDVTLLKADWTLHDARITSTLKNEFDRAAVPVNVIYLPGAREGVLLPEILTAGDVTKVLEELPDS